jgi:hypothetical protein
MNGSELHAQAGVWHYHRTGIAALFMEGEAADRAPGALYRVVLGSGLRLTTDLDHLVSQPIPGWRLVIDRDERITLTWPRFHPLLDHAPVDLPSGWRGLATGSGMVEVFVGHRLGLHEHAGGTPPLPSLVRAAESGALAAGMVRVEVD